MPQGSTITPQPQAGQQGPAWIRWLERYAQEHAAAVAPIAVRDFPPMVRAQITQEADGETMTPSTMQIVVTLLARLGAAHGLRQVPFTMEDAVTMTQALVLDKALATLRMSAVLGEPSMGCASPLGAALQFWLGAVLRARRRPAAGRPVGRLRAGSARGVPQRSWSGRGWCRDWRRPEKGGQGFSQRVAQTSLRVEVCGFVATGHTWLLVPGPWCSWAGSSRRAGPRAGQGSRPQAWRGQSPIPTPQNCAAAPTEQAAGTWSTRWRDLPNVARQAFAPG